MKKVSVSSDLTFQSKEDIKRRRKIKRRVFWIKFILIFVLISTSVVLLAISPLFTIRSIEVKGNTHDSREAIIQITGLETAMNGFKSIGDNPLSLLSLRDRDGEKKILKNFPYIKMAVVRFALPDKIKIIITERNPVAKVRFQGTSLLLDGDMTVMEAGAKVDEKKILEIKGIKFNRYALGEKLSLEEPGAFADFLSFIKEIKKSDQSDKNKIFPILKELDISDPSNVTGSINGRIRVNFGGLTELNYRLNFLRRILEGKINKSVQGSLDLTLENPVLKPE